MLDNQVYELTSGGLKPLNFGGLEIGARVKQADKWEVGTVCAKASCGWLVVFEDGSYSDSQSVGSLSPYTRITPVDEPNDTPARVAELLQLKAVWIAEQRAEQARKDEQKRIDTLKYTQELRAKCPWAKDNNPSKNLKKELGMAFPGVKFSVRADGNSLRVNWDFGPTGKAVEAIANKYENGHFDGMQDMHEYDGSAYGRALDAVLGRRKYVFCSRDMGDWRDKFSEKVQAGLCALQGMTYNGGNTDIYPNGGNGWHDTVQCHANIVLAETTFPHGFTTVSEFSVVRKTDAEQQAAEVGEHWAKIVFPESEKSISPSPNAQVPSAPLASIEGVTVTENEEKDGVEIKFSAKPDATTLQAVKDAGFRWSKFAGLWWAKRDAQTLAFARRLTPIENLELTIENEEIASAPVLEVTQAPVAAENVETVCESPIGPLDVAASESDLSENTIGPLPVNLSASVNAPQASAPLRASMPKARRPRAARIPKEQQTSPANGLTPLEVAAITEKLQAFVASEPQDSYTIEIGELRYSLRGCAKDEAENMRLVCNFYARLTGGILPGLTDLQAGQLDILWHLRKKPTRYRANDDIKATTSTPNGNSPEKRGLTEAQLEELRVIENEISRQYDRSRNPYRSSAPADLPKFSADQRAFAMQMRNCYGPSRRRWLVLLAEQFAKLDSEGLANGEAYDLMDNLYRKAKPHVKAQVDAIRERGERAKAEVDEFNRQQELEQGGLVEIQHEGATVTVRPVTVKGYEQFQFAVGPHKQGFAVYEVTTGAIISHGGWRGFKSEAVAIKHFNEEMAKETITPEKVTNWINARKAETMTDTTETNEQTEMPAEVETAESEPVCAEAVGPQPEPEIAASEVLRVMRHKVETSGSLRFGQIDVHIDEQGILTAAQCVTSRNIGMIDIQTGEIVPERDGDLAKLQGVLAEMTADTQQALNAENLARLKDYPIRNAAGIARLSGAIEPICEQPIGPQESEAPTDAEWPRESENYEGWTREDFEKQPENFGPFVALGWQIVEGVGPIESALLEIGAQVLLYGEPYEVTRRYTTSNGLERVAVVEAGRPKTIDNEESHILSQYVRRATLAPVCADSVGPLPTEQPAEQTQPEPSMRERDRPLSECGRAVGPKTVSIMPIAHRPLREGLAGDILYTSQRGEVVKMRETLRPYVRCEARPPPNAYTS